MANKNPDIFNVIKVIDIDSLRTMAIFTCAQCVNRTKCRHCLKDKKNCEVSCKLFELGNKFTASLDGDVDTQFYVNNLKDKNILIKTINDYRKCRN